MVNLRYSLAFFLLILFVPISAAENHTVTVTQTGDLSSYYFEPSVLEVEVGDSVLFVWGDGSHNVAQVEGSSSTNYISGFYSGKSQVGGNWSLPSNYTSADGTL